MAGAERYHTHSMPSEQIYLRYPTKQTDMRARRGRCCPVDLRESCSTSEGLEKRTAGGHLRRFHYGMPVGDPNIRPYFNGDGSPNDPGASLFAYLAGWFFEMDLWRAGAAVCGLRSPIPNTQLTSDAALCLPDAAAAAP